MTNFNDHNDNNENQVLEAKPNRSNSNIVKSARNIGLAAIAAATITGIAFTQQSSGTLNVVSAAGFAPTTPPPTAEAGLYVDGKYDGALVRAGRWGNMQVRAVIENGKLVDIEIIDYPHSRSLSQRISNQAIPWLIEEAIAAQSADIDIITGATPTSEAFIRSLEAALESAMTNSDAAANSSNNSSGVNGTEIGGTSL